MSFKLNLDRSFDNRYGQSLAVAPGVRKVLANNPGPFTYNGTATHIVGRGEVAVIDPGPDNPAHIEALLAATKGEVITHIVLTHTHRDHAGGVAQLAAKTGALVCGCAPWQVPEGEDTGKVDAGHETSYQPNLILQDGDGISGPHWRLSAVATPGHSSNHLAFALENTGILFPGDHVMSWSTTVIAPPDGSLRAYMNSLDRLLERDDTLFLPAHGAAIRSPGQILRALKSHRRQRDGSIQARLVAGDRTIAEIVARSYVGLDPRLHRAASLSVMAHLLDLIDRGLVTSDPTPHLESRFEPSAKLLSASPS